MSAGVMFPFLYGPDEFVYVDSFFKRMVIGASYETGALGFSFMMGFQPWVDEDYDTWAAADAKDKTAVFTHVGFKFGINDAMTLKADFVGGFGYKGVNFTDGKKESKLLAALGVNFDYSADPLNVGITLKMLDFGDVGYYDSDLGGLAMVINPYLGFQINDPLKVTLGITIEKGLGDYNKDNDKGYNVSTLEIAPGLEWTVAEGASMTFGYDLKFDLNDKAAVEGYKDNKLLTHNITMGFKWSF